MADPLRFATIALPPPRQDSSPSRGLRPGHASVRRSPAEEVAIHESWRIRPQIRRRRRLRAIARELVETVRRNVTIDWTIRENVRAQLRVLVKRILRKHGYPPDKQEKATQTVLEQAEVLSEIWAAPPFFACPVLDRDGKVLP